jgi:hypothetical protein
MKVGARADNGAGIGRESGGDYERCKRGGVERSERLSPITAAIRKFRKGRAACAAKVRRRLETPKSGFGDTNFRDRRSFRTLPAARRRPAQVGYDGNRQHGCCRKQQEPGYGLSSVRHGVFEGRDHDLFGGRGAGL